MPRPIVTPYAASPVVSLPHSAAQGSVHHVECPTCVQLITDRDKCRERDDEAGAQKLDTALTDHIAVRHVVEAGL